MTLHMYYWVSPERIRNTSNGENEHQNNPMFLLVG